MKKLLLSTFLAAASWCAAQPVLQSTNFMPPAFSCDVSFGSAVSAGSAGANQTWNFSSLTTTPGGTLTVVPANSTPCFSSFSSSNWAQAIPGGQVNYFIRSSSQLEMVATNVQSNCTAGDVYSTTKTILQFPMSFNGTFTDSYVDNFGPGSLTVTYDGYGTLIIPTATLTNVVRTVTVDGSATTYNWYTTGNPSYLVMISQSNSTVLFTNPMVGVNKIDHAAIVNVYPNPSNGLVTIQTSNASTQQLIVTDVTGKIVFARGVEGTQSIDLNHLNAGVYTVTLRSGNEVSNQKLVITK